MTAVAVAPLGRAEVLQWLAPAPLWDGPAGTLGRPWIAEFRSDTFVDDFLALLAATGGSPVGLAELEPSAREDQDQAPYRLFRPLSQRYYLVTANLVCRRPGIPDHTVRADADEQVFFVMRRLTEDGEEAFVPGPNGGWVAATAAALVAGEQRHPMHPAPVTPYAEPGTTAAALGLARDGGRGRTVLYGYIPVGVADDLVRPMADPVKALAELAASQPAGTVPDPVHGWLLARVVEPWRRLRLPPTPPNVPYASLFLLLDLGDWLFEHLRVVHDAVRDDTTLSGAAQALLTGMEGVTVVRSSGGDVTLRQAVKDTLGFRALLAGEDVSGPAVTYDLRRLTPAPPPDPAPDLVTWLGVGAGSLSQLAKDALAAHPPTLELPPELEGVIPEQPTQRPGSPPGAPSAYVIRAVLEHPPCRPVLSEATHAFELARPMDPDAPARKVLLQLPDITHLRRYERGIAFEMPPALKRMVDRVTPEMMKGDGPGPDPGLQLGWICSFSLQIVFLVAFIVMFIFLILLNIVFWWLPFLKICFPVPVKAPAPKGPTP